jgi:hypothetical protein
VSDIDIDSMQHAWQRWWDYEGSAMRPHPSEDTEQFAGRITKIAWLNGAYKCLGDVERLRAELAAAIKQRDEARENLRDACKESAIRVNTHAMSMMELENEFSARVTMAFVAAMRKEGGGA